LISELIRQCSAFTGENTEFVEQNWNSYMMSLQNRHVQHVIQSLKWC